MTRDEAEKEFRTKALEALGNYGMLSEAELRNEIRADDLFSQRILGKMVKEGMIHCLTVQVGGTERKRRFYSVSHVVFHWNKGEPWLNG